MGYSLVEIDTARKYIKEMAAESIFGHKGGANFISLNGNDVRDLFNLYDVVFFQSQIHERIGNLNTPSELKFYANERTSGAGGICSIDRVGGLGGRCTYYIDIAPNVINTIFKRNKSGSVFAAGVGCEDRLECLQLIMEHEIIHLLMILWEYYDSPMEGRKDEKVYSAHGLLFQCMIKEYFGHSRFEHDLGLTSIEIEGHDVPEAFLKYKEEKRGVIPFGYAYWSNSCYLDSLMTVLLGSVSTFWRMGIMDVKIDSIIYKKGVCPAIDTFQKLKDHAQKIQTQIVLDFKSLHTKSSEDIKCSNLRSLLAVCLPGMRVRSTWVTYNVGSTYETLAGLFPGLQIDVPVQNYRWRQDLGTYIPDPISYHRLAMLAMWDYLDPLTNIGVGDDYQKIRWDLFQSPIIVFNNGGTPRIKKFNEVGNEKGLNIIAGGRHPFDVNKARAFGETIIDDRYRLVGVITLQGVPQSGEGGTHYVAHFMGTDQKWYYYNDLTESGKIEPIAKLPIGGVWREENQKMPVMYFYQKIRDRILEKPKVRIEIPRLSPEKRDPNEYQGQRLTYKKIPASEERTSIFVYDNTSGTKLIGILDKLNPRPDTKIDYRTRYWKIENEDLERFETTLREIDSRPGTPPAKRPETGIDSVEYGVVYKKYPVKKVNIYNYSDRLLAITGMGAKDLEGQVSGGLELNLKYGLGKGYIYPKKKLEELENILN